VARQAQEDDARRGNPAGGRAARGVERRVAAVRAGVARESDAMARRGERARMRGDQAPQAALEHRLALVPLPAKEASEGREQGAHAAPS
jgi:hypothetical protein